MVSLDIDPSRISCLNLNCCWTEQYCSCIQYCKNLLKMNKEVGMLLPKKVPSAQKKVFIVLYTQHYPVTLCFSTVIMWSPLTLILLEFHTSTSTVAALNNIVPASNIVCWEILVTFSIDDFSKIKTLPILIHHRHCRALSCLPILGFQLLQKT